MRSNTLLQRIHDKDCSRKWWLLESTAKQSALRNAHYIYIYARITITPDIFTAPRNERSCTHRAVGAVVAGITANTAVNSLSRNHMLMFIAMRVGHSLL